ncbi:MAG: hypothetical protein JST96_10375 [Bacteroidetes bacterium]|nr:hypothetical protein [Bacteroidota bacterium]
MLNNPLSKNIAAISWFIESKGLIATADKFADAVYDFFLTLSDTRKSYTVCKEPERAALGYKCITFKKKYTVVFIESATEVIICEFIASKLIYW